MLPSLISFSFLNIVLVIAGAEEKHAKILSEIELLKKDIEKLRAERDLLECVVRDSLRRLQQARIYVSQLHVLSLKNIVEQNYLDLALECLLRTRESKKLSLEKLKAIKSVLDSLEKKAKALEEALKKSSKVKLESLITSWRKAPL